MENATITSLTELEVMSMATADLGNPEYKLSGQCCCDQCCDDYICKD